MARQFNPAEHGGEDMDGFTQPPPDDYFVRIERADLKKSQGGGNPYINLTLRVAGGQYDNSKFWDTCSLLENAIWKLGDCCKSIGQTSVFDIESQSDIRAALEKKVGKVKTKWEEFEGQKRTRVVKWLMCSDEERHTAGGSTSSTDPNAPSPAGGAPRGGGGFQDDNIPF